MEKNGDEEIISLNVLARKIDNLTTIVEKNNHKNDRDVRYGLCFTMLAFALAYFSLGASYVLGALVFIILGIILITIPVWVAIYNRMNRGKSDIKLK